MEQSDIRNFFKINLPIILSILLYILIYFLRFQQGGWEPNLDLLSSLRGNLDGKIEQLLPSPQAELLSGILLGEKKDLPPWFKLALRDSSTLHIVVVSGQNLTMLAGLFLGLAGLLKRKVAIVISLMAIIFYTILTGAQVPVIRAAVMASIAFVAQIFGRQRDGVWVLLITGALMLLVNPNWLFELSFQLSFLATLGVVAVSPIIARRLDFLPQFISQDLAVTTGAQLMVIPVIAQNFHQLSLVGLFANLLVAWTVPIIMILGSLMLILGYLWADFAHVISLLPLVFLTYFIYIVQFFSSLPFAWEYVEGQSFLVWVGYYLILAGILIALSRAHESTE